jgi:ABC-type transport system substrate-binding protein
LIYVISRRVTIGAALIAVLALAACADQTNGARSVAAPSGSAVSVYTPGSPVSWPPATDMGALNHSIIYSAMQLSLTPPGAGDTPAIDAASAYGACKVDAACPTGGSGPDIVLALASSPLGGSVASDGSTQPKLQDTLAYVLTWNDVPCVGSGPGNPKYSTATAVSTCIWVAVIDANTGKSLESTDTNVVGG